MLQRVVAGFQERKAAVSDDLVRSFMDKNRAIDPAVTEPGSTAHLQHEAGSATTVASVAGA